MQAGIVKLGSQLLRWKWNAPSAGDYGQRVGQTQAETETKTQRVVALLSFARRRYIRGIAAYVPPCGVGTGKIQEIVLGGLPGFLDAFDIGAHSKEGFQSLPEILQHESLKQSLLACPGACTV